MVQLNTFKMFWLIPFTFHIILSEISRQTQNYCTDLIAASSFVKISACEFASGNGDDGGDNKIFFFSLKIIIQFPPCHALLQPVFIQSFCL